MDYPAFLPTWSSLFASGDTVGSTLLDTKHAILRQMKAKPELANELKTCAVIFIPVDRSLQGVATIELLRDHIAFETNFEGEYRTASGKIIKMSGNELRTGNGFKESRKVHISSIFPLNAAKPDGNPHGIEISRPITGGIESPDNDDELDENFTRKMIATLRCYPENESIFRELDLFVIRTNFSVSETPSYFFKMNPPIHQVAKSVWQNYSDRLVNADSLSPRSISRFSNISPSKSAHYQISVESCIMTGIHTHAWQWVQAAAFERTKNFRQCLDRLNAVTFVDFQLPTAFHCDLLNAIKELQSVSLQESPADKLMAIKRCYCEIANSVEIRSKFQFWAADISDLSTDDVVSIMALVIIKGYPRTGLLIADLDYIEKFRFVDTSMSHLGYSLNSLQTAVAWIVDQFGSLSTSISCSLSLSKSIMSQYLGTAVARQTYQSSDNLARNYIEHDVVLVAGDLAQSVSLEPIHNDGRVMMSLEMNEVCTDADEKCRIVDDIIVWIDMSSTSMCMCTGQGKLRCVGLSSNGLLGMGDYVCYDDTAPMLTPYSIISTGVEKFIRVACGRHHILALSSSGSLFSWGKNDHGQLGLGNHNLSSYIATRPCEIDGFDSANMATCIACGDYHCLVSTDTGSLYSWGMSFGGRLGYKPEVDQQVRTFKSLVISKLSRSRNDDSKKDKEEDDELYEWPDVSSPRIISSFGSLLQSLAEDASSSTYVPVIVFVSCGSNHNLALSVEGTVYSWGIGKFGQLGHGDNRNELYPRQIDCIPSSAKIRQTCASGNKSIFLTTQSRLIGCGVGVSVKIGDNSDTCASLRDYMSRHCHQSLPLAKPSNKCNQVSFPVPVPISQSDFGNLMTQLEVTCEIAENDASITWPQEVVQISCNDFEILSRSSTGGVYSLGSQPAGWKELFSSKVSKICANRRSSAVVLGRSNVL